jgi:carbohydrate-selective porin OprB
VRPPRFEYLCRGVLRIHLPPSGDRRRTLPSGKWWRSRRIPRLAYVGAAFVNLGGGVRHGGTYTSNLNLRLNVDGAALFGWPDTTAYLDAPWLQGGSPSSFIGDAQWLSNISAPNAVKLYEAWIQTNFLDNRISVLGGLYDLSSEFYRLQSTGLLVNSSFGIGPEFGQTASPGRRSFQAPRSRYASPLGQRTARLSAWRCSTVFRSIGPMAARASSSAGMVR